MAMQDPYIVSSTNLFIDSKDDNNPVSEGDNVTINLGNLAINAGDGETLKLSMTQFSMYNSFFKVNENNNRIDLAWTSSTIAATNIGVVIPHGDYQTQWQIYNAFAEAIRVALAANAPPLAVTCVVQPAAVFTNPAGTPFPAPLPAVLTGSETGPLLGQLTNNFFNLVITPPALETVTECRVICFEEVSDSYSLLGGNKFPIGGNAASLIPPAAGTNLYGFGDASLLTTIAAGAGGTVTLQNVYPARQSTEAHIYVRTNLLSNNITQSNLQAKGQSGQSSSSAMASDVLAKIPIDSEFTNFESNYEEGEWFLTLTQKHIDSLKVYLTDSRGRPLGRNVQNQGLKTAAGLINPATGLLYTVPPCSSRQQTSFGNLYFNAVIRIDVVHAFNPKMLQTQPVRRTVPSSLVGVLEKLDFGKSSFDDN
tara:strand:- start:3074 stop:4342 length:1269 start_codon:yes stop_codon:yes gene_type:complete